MPSTGVKVFKGDMPPRAALADAIAASAEAAAQLSAAEAAVDPAMKAVWAADRVVEDARGALEQAKVEMAQHLRDVALGTASGSPRMIRDARDALTDAEDALQAARDAKAAVEAQIPEHEERADRARQRVANAALAVFKAEAAPLAAVLAEELAQAQRVAASKGAVLAWLVRCGAVAAEMVPMPGEENKNPMVRRMVAGPLKQVLDRHNTPASIWDGTSSRGPFVGVPDAVAPWEAALAALHRDADAVLPG